MSTPEGSMNCMIAFAMARYLEQLAGKADQESNMPYRRKIFVTLKRRGNEHMVVLARDPEEGSTTRLPGGFAVHMRGEFEASYMEAMKNLSKKVLERIEAIGAEDKCRKEFDEGEWELWDRCKAESAQQNAQAEGYMGGNSNDEKSKKEKIVSGKRKRKL